MPALGCGAYNPSLGGQCPAGPRQQLPSRYEVAADTAGILGYMTPIAGARSRDSIRQTGPAF